MNHDLKTIRPIAFARCQVRTPCQGTECFYRPRKRNTANVYFSKAAFYSPETMFLVMGHEFGHVQHALAGIVNNDIFSEEDQHIPIHQWMGNAALQNRWQGFYKDFQALYPINFQYADPKLDILNLPFKLKK